MHKPSAEVRQFFSGVSQFIVGSLLLELLAPFAHGFLPSKNVFIPLNTAIALLLWLCGIAGLILAAVKLRSYRTLALEVIDARCKELIHSCVEIRETYPQLLGPITSSAYVPLPDLNSHGEKAAMHKFRGRFFDFLNDANRFSEHLRLKLPLPDEKSVGNLDSVDRDLTEIRNRIQMLLFL